MGDVKCCCECFRILVERVCCDDFSGSFLGVLCLYLQYSHTSSVSKGCVGDGIPCVLYMCVFWDIFRCLYINLACLILEQLSYEVYFGVMGFAGSWHIGNYCGYVTRQGGPHKCGSSLTSWQVNLLKPIAPISVM